MSRLGAKLKELRGELSLSDIAAELEVSKVQVLRYEQGERIPTKEMLQKFCGLYDIAYKDLRKLYYDDFFSEPVERSIALEWAKEQLAQKE